ncbi:MAG: hypothetical protein AAFQ27_12025 [Pseudomonadota bacterium]
MISGLFGLVFAIAFVAAIAIGMAFLLDVVARKASITIRAVVAALVAGFVPMSIPIGAVLSATDADPITALLPLFVGGFVLALLVGFPAAFFFTRNRVAARGDTIDPGTFE